MFLEICILAVTTIFLWLYLKTQIQRKLFDDSGIRYVKPYPLFGNLASVFFGRKHIATVLNNIQKNFPDDKYFGVFNFMKPVIVIQDLNLVRNVTIKKFPSFHDHIIQLPDDTEQIMGRSLFILKDGFVELESRDVVTKFTTDVIASTAFGLKVDSHKDKGNLFFRMGQLVSYLSVPKFLVYCTYPKIMKHACKHKDEQFSSMLQKKIFGINLLPKESTVFFRTLVKDSIAQREAHKIYRPDMIHLLMEIKKGTLQDDDIIGDTEYMDLERERKAIKLSWNDDDLAGQALLFFLAGFEAVTTTSNFLFYTLTHTPEIQEKLYQEILETKRQHADDISYEVLHSLDMVISEVMRRYPTGSSFIDRRCTLDYILPPARVCAKEYKLKKGASIWLSSGTIHRSPQYWPDPDKFIPERFSTKNRQNIVPLSYLPFGSGSRSCIANRFALMELKILAFSIVSKFEIVKTPKSRVDLEYQPTSLNVRIKGGMWFGLKLRGN